jgi:RHH-type proline utilization regulon transcriptional repressor/proline dehydrogenase/delta 1-pyrroline-5-carboxylate dehydrogenase
MSLGTAPAALDAEILEVGRRLARRRPSRGAAVRAGRDRAMALASRDPQVRAALFRMVDVAPACSTPAELAEHLEALLADVDEPAAAVRLATEAAGGPLAPAVGRLAAAAVHQMAGAFIVGESPLAAASVLRRLWSRGAAVTVDLLGEATVTHEEGRAYAAACDAALRTLAGESARWPEQPLLERDGAGVLPRVNLSLKVTALTPLVRPQAPARGRDDAADLLRGLLRRAREVGAHLHIDMESLDSREMVLELVMEVLGEREFARGPSAGVVLQTYLRDSEQMLERVLEWSRASGRTPPLTVRLVKGAYWDHETIEAARSGWQPPVFTDKADSDRSFERLTRRLIDAWGSERLVRPAIASHNLRSLAHAIVYAQHAGLASADFELQVLRGLGDDLQESLTAEGFRARVYCPVGNLLAGMAYLVRRLLENTSNDSFLASRVSGATLDDLLAPP